ncbi:ATP-binding cassette sub-family G member 1-like [Uranotaenia lowii]|uniref:ATP-binding cassette sub-family G member 1-like n=1 Tax=Uranotaenia lowii TaxID=190385 RepID=UPI00247AEE81|nr:ATP-binding cassette sub-family G member 1-like [Uranotaenia lowii]
MEESDNFTLSFHDLCYHSSKNGEQILTNVSGSFTSGRLTCILGPSGAGKSSLLNVLSGHRKVGVTGQLRLNGVPVTSKQQRKLISYTPQEACLWMNLTVEESMAFAADFKLSPKISKPEKQQICRELLEVIGLEKCCQTLVKNLSGGELKRLSIGVELVSDPKVLLLDEPTSGLDTVSSYQVLSYVQRLTTQQNRAIICVIHQPGSKLLQLFQDMFILTRGRELYCGPLDQMIETFKTAQLECPLSHNPADFALEVASLDFEDERLQMLMELQNNNNKSYFVEAIETSRGAIIEEQQSFMLSSWQQLGVLLRRSFRCALRDSYNLKARTLVCIATALLVGVTFYDVGSSAAKLLSNTSIIVVIMFLIYFVTLFAAILTYPLESAAFIREHKNNWYALTPYYISKLLVEMPSLIFSTSAAIFIIYYLTSQPLDWYRVLAIWATAILSGWITLVLGLALGALFPVNEAILHAILVIILTTLFSGFFIVLDQMAWYMKPLSYLSFVRYSFESAVHIFYGFGRQSVPCPETFCYFTLKKFLKLVAMPELAWGYDILGLVVWGLAMQILLYVSLLKRIKQDV